MKQHEQAQELTRRQCFLPEGQLSECQTSEEVWSQEVSGKLGSWRKNWGYWNPLIAIVGQAVLQMEVVQCGTLWQPWHRVRSAASETRDQPKKILGCKMTHISSKAEICGKIENRCILGGLLKHCPFLISVKHEAIIFCRRLSLGASCRWGDMFSR